MKNLKLLSALFLIGAMWSCDPLEDDIKEMNDNYAYSKDVEYTLTSDDYDDINDLCDCTGFGNFSNEDDAKANIPAILPALFPGLADGSSAKVTYDLYVGDADGLRNYTRSDSYTVSETDYTNADAGAAGFFNNSITATDNLPGILAANKAGAAAGDLVAVSYEYNSIEYADISGEVITSEDFESYVIGVDDLNAFDVYSDEGAESWYLYASSTPYQAARMSGFKSGNQPNVDWLILPSIDLTDYPDAKLKLSHVVNFLGSGTLGADVAVKISTDYNGTDHTVATWNDLELDTWPTGDSYDIVASEASLSGYANMEVSIAFYYKSTIDYAPQWRLVEITVEQGEVIETTNYNVFYEFDGSKWIPNEDNVYYLSSNDYDQMGSPGKYNNFSSSDPADNYIPTMLTRMFPFAQEDQSIYVIYKYFSSSAGETQTRGNLYTYTNGTWSGHSSVMALQFSFGLNGGVWEPDNTIKYSLTVEDYIAIADATAESNPSGSGSAGNYKNFDISLWTSDQIFDAITARLLDISEIMKVNDQKYLVTYATWEPGAGSGSIHVIYSDAAGAFIAVQ